MTVSERDNSIISLQGRVQVPTGGKAREPRGMIRITEDRISSSGIGNCFRAFLMKRIREKLGITEIYISG